MYHLLIRQKLEDYDRWWMLYEAAYPERKQAGLEERNVFRNMSDPNEVFILYAFQDLMKAEVYVAKLDTEERLREEGVVGGIEAVYLT